VTSWKYIPIEVVPLAAPAAKRTPTAIGSPDPKIRQGSPAKGGPVVTDNGNWFIGAPFTLLLTPSDLKGEDGRDGRYGVWEVGLRIEEIVGVLEVGLFHGRNGAQVAAAGEEGVVRNQWPHTLAWRAEKWR
jgi:ribose 5-phosphate isomerase A